MMLKRVVVINDFCTAGGGAAALAVSSATWLRQRDMEVVFISGDDNENPIFREHGIVHVALGQKSLMEVSPVSALVSGLFNRSARDAILKWIDQNDTDGTVYHLHNWSQILSPSIFSALRRVAHRVVLSAHDFFLACPNGAYAIYPKNVACPLVPLSLVCIRTDCDRRNYGHKVWRVLRQIVLNSVRDLGGARPPIIALHEGMVPLLERGGIALEDIRVLRNPAMPFSESRIRAENNREFLFIGRLHSAKGADLAAEAARMAGASLCLVGDGPSRKALEQDYPELKITGWQSQKGIVSWATKARALIMPSRYPEPFGLVAVEALLSGLPVLVASSALLAPEIQARGMGYACDPTDIRSMAKLMNMLLDDDRLTQRMSERAFKDAHSLATTPDLWTSELVKIYQSRVG